MPKTINKHYRLLERPRGDGALQNRQLVLRRWSIGSLSGFVASPGVSGHGPPQQLFALFYPR